ncbi:FHA domain-containing protein [Labedella gwakjiensis]|uniref:FHA domain-containing protein n=1 Tax=Labedella gwakjiensis TaxID=390269 RepID=A0A2P8GS45_9MICO|nr:FHA domain-containing protein [Labedella gwakjiensis]PSL36772.1 FHA domain-containing protein [Labedella gwakjiensis]
MGSSAPPWPDAPSLDTVRPPIGGASAPHPPADVPVTAPTTIESPVLHFPDGSSAVIGRGVLLGRDPVTQSEHPAAVLVRVHDVARSVSKTHALVTWERGHVWVSDLHSTNGTAIVDDDGFETACSPEVPTPVPSGHSLLLGALRVVVQRTGR